jgi:hypothetical protein
MFAFSAKRLVYRGVLETHKGLIKTLKNSAKKQGQFNRYALNTTSHLPELRILYFVFPFFKAAAVNRCHTGLTPGYDPECCRALTHHRE